MNDVEPLPPDDPAEAAAERDPRAFFLNSCVFEGGLALLAGGIGWLVGYSPVQTFAWSWSALAWGLLAVGPMFFGAWLLGRVPWRPVQQFCELLEREVRPLFVGLSVWELAALSLFAGIGEETLFRGLIQGGFAAWIGGAEGLWIGLIAASLLFGAMHPLSRMYVLICAAMGVYFGLLWLWTGNLLAPIVAHAVYDFVVLLYLTRWSLTPENASDGA